MNQQQRRALREENKKYGSALEEIHRSLWPQARPGDTSVRIAVWRSKHFCVQIFDEEKAIRITVNRTDVNGDGEWRGGITWDELQAIKSECGYGTWMAIEFYPPDEHVVNVANMRHLWIPKTKAMPDYWRKGT